MFVTLDTFHFERSPLNELRSENISDMEDTPDTSHSAIGPCGLLEQSFFGDNLRHASTALLSSALDTNAEVIADVLLKCEGEIGMCICARTTARIRSHVDNEHEKQDDKHPKTNESVNVGGLLYMYMRMCMCVFLRLSMCTNTWAWVCLPACVVTLQCAYAF